MSRIHERANLPLKVAAASHEQRDRRPTEGQATAIRLVAVVEAYVPLPPGTDDWSPSDSLNVRKMQWMNTAAREELTASWPCGSLRGLALSAHQGRARLLPTGHTSSREGASWTNTATVTQQRCGPPIVAAKLRTSSMIHALPLALDLHFEDACAVALGGVTRSRHLPLKTPVVGAPRLCGLIPSVSVAYQPGNVGTGDDVARRCLSALPAHAEGVAALEAPEGADRMSSTQSGWWSSLAMHEESQGSLRMDGMRL